MSGQWNHLRSAPFDELADLLSQQQSALDKTKRQRAVLMSACETLLDRMTDGRGEADEPTLEEWARDLRAAIERSRR